MKEQPDSACVYVIRISKSRVNLAICKSCMISPEQLIKNQLKPIIVKVHSTQPNQETEIAEKEKTIDLDS